MSDRRLNVQVIETPKPNVKRYLLPDSKTRSRLALVGLMVFTMVLPTGCKPNAQRNGGSQADLKVIHSFRTTNYKSLDPPRQFDAVSMEIINNVYDPLLEYHYLKRPYELVPNLLTKLPELAEDKVTYRFTLREGIQFHDDPCFEGGKGRELTADDVLFTLKRFADVNVNVNSYPVLLKGRIKGLDAFRDKTRQQKNLDYTQEVVEGLKQIDRYSFEIVLTEPDSLALMSFASGGLAIVPPEAVAKYGQKLEHHAVGTGPFMLAKNPRRGEIVLKKNPNYHGVYPSKGDPEDESKGLLEDAGQSIPLVDEVRMPLIEEAQPRMLKFLKGEIDLIGFDRDNFVKMAYKDDKGFHLKDDYAQKFEIDWVQSLSSGYYSINMKDSVLGKNKALRQAIAYALDTPSFIDKMMNGRGSALNTIVPLPIAGSEETIDIKWYPTNLDKAKAKLVEAGYPNGKGLGPITVEYRTSTTLTRQNYEFTRAQLAKVGIQLKGNFQPFSAFLRKVDDGNFQIADSGWQADYPDAENFYQLLYGPNQAPGPNSSSYQNAEYDKLYGQMRRMSPGPERNQIITQMAALIKEDVPVILRVNPIAVGLHQKWVGNVKRNLMVDPLKFLNIDEDTKAKGLR